VFGGREIQGEPTDVDRGEPRELDDADARDLDLA
jgi:hypothetical protein